MVSGRFAPRYIETRKSAITFVNVNGMWLCSRCKYLWTGALKGVKSHTNWSDLRGVLSESTSTSVGTRDADDTGSPR